MTISANQYKSQVSGILQTKKNSYYAVLDFIDWNQKRKRVWINVGVNKKDGKKRATYRLKWVLEQFHVPQNEAMFEYEIKMIREKIQEIELTENNDCSFYKSVLTKETEFTRIFQYYIESIYVLSVQMNTYYNTRNKFYTRIQPYFYPFNIKISDVSTFDIVNFLKLLGRGQLKNQKNPVKQSTVAAYLILFKQFFTWAKENEFITRNPCIGIKITNNNPSIAKFYTLDEIKVLLKCLQGTRMELPVYMATIYGLRRGEIAGLTWNNIDFDKKEIYITSITKEYYDGKTCVVKHENHTKTKSSIRTMPLIPFIEDLLIREKNITESHMLQLKERFYHEDDDFVFRTSDGHKTRPGYFTQMIRYYEKQFKLKPMNFHGLRHSCATLLYKNDTNLKDIQMWLGHSSIETTSKTYLHLDYTDKTKTAEKMNYLFKNFQ